MLYDNHIHIINEATTPPEIAAGRFEIPTDLHAKREAFRKRDRERKREVKRIKALMDRTPDQPAIRIQPRWVDVMPQVTKAQFDRYCKAKTHPTTKRGLFRDKKVERKCK